MRDTPCVPPYNSCSSQHCIFRLCNHLGSSVKRLPKHSLSHCVHTMSASHGSEAAGSGAADILDARIVTHQQLELLAARLKQYAAGQTAVVQRLEEAVDHQAALTAARFATGEDKLQEAMTKLAQSIDGVGKHLEHVQSAVEQKIKTNDSQMTDALTALTQAIGRLEQKQLSSTVPQAQQPPGLATSPMPAPNRTMNTVLTGEFGTARSAADPNATAGQTAAPDPSRTADPWLNPGEVRHETRGESLGGCLKSKDFTQIERYDGNFGTFPNWADRMESKLRRAHPRLGAMLRWAEGQTVPITEAMEDAADEPGLNTRNLSEGMYDILLERTGAQLYDKRRNAGAGRGFEFWRILKRDFGTSSTDAQLAKLQMYTEPTRCSTLAELGPALDRWEALGRELGRPVDDDFRLLALRKLVPKNVVDMLTAQVSLRSFPEALMFVRRQAAEHRHFNQVQEVQRRGTKGGGHAPMDLSAALLAAIAQIRAGESVSEEPAEEDPDLVETLIAAVKGKGKGKGKSKGIEMRECYNCGKKGHLSRDCFQKKNAEADGTKGKGKGKSKGANALEVVDDDWNDEGINIRCLTRACGPEVTIAACERGVEPEDWEGFERVEATIDSGAGDCVCGPQHFEAVRHR